MLLTSVCIVAQVPQSVVKEVVSEADVRRYETYGMRSFVEDNRQLTWCPSPGCEHAVEARVEVGSEPMDIACSCGATFCFQCKEEAHRPVSTSACNVQGCYARLPVVLQCRCRSWKSQSRDKFDTIFCIHRYAYNCQGQMAYLIVYL